MAGRRRKPGSSPQGDLFGRSKPRDSRSRTPRASAKPRAKEAHDPGKTKSFATAALVCLPTDTEPLSYGIQPEHRAAVQRGRRVTVPLRGRLVVGVVWKLVATDELGFPVEKLRPIVDVLDDRPALSDAALHTVEFIARYYHCSRGMALRTALPAPLRRTGLERDTAPIKTAWHAAIIEGVDWPLDLRKGERKVLERLLAAGEVNVKQLRRAIDPETGKSKTVSVPQKMLQKLADGGLIRLWQERVLRDPLGLRRAVERDLPPLATEDQGKAVRRIGETVQAGRFEAFVLRGVTGSGKTEVYMRVIAAALLRDEQDRDAGAIVLVPEIALTPQLVNRFRARFGEMVAVLHSALTPGERYDQLTRISRGDARIVIGPRSALFAPLRRLTVIVMDECHDSSFKQQSGVRYHARDVALVLARHANAVCILGSATPGCRELHLVANQHATRLDMASRVLGRPMPESELVDLRTADRLRDEELDRPSLLSRRLVDAIADTVGRNEQAIVLHNRRGFATTVVCAACGAPFECPDCAISLTVHRRQGRMRCHYCDHTEPLDQSCPSCKATNLLHVGSGTERLEETLANAIPGMTVRRFDRDTASGRRLLDTLNAFRQRRIDVLVGTQMLAKGHDFPAVTLVGVALAETGLRVPDYLAAERTFQLLTQVSGRAGRGEVPGRVIVQTYSPDHPAIRMALGHDHAAFSAWEMEQRRRTNYPPFAHLALVESKSKDLAAAQRAITAAAGCLRGLDLEVRGPVAAGVSRIRGVHRFHALIRSRQRPPLHAGLHALASRVTPHLPANVRLHVDVDPTEFS